MSSSETSTTPDATASARELNIVPKSSTMTARSVGARVNVKGRRPARPPVGVLSFHTSNSNPLQRKSGRIDADMAERRREHSHRADASAKVTSLRAEHQPAIDTFLLAGLTSTCLGLAPGFFPIRIVTTPLSDSAVTLSVSTVSGNSTKRRKEPNRRSH